MATQHKTIDMQQMDRQYYLPVFKRIPLTLVRGEGCRVWDDEGNEYLDALAGIAVNCLGHCHPAVAGAVSAQAARLMHISNFFVSPPQAELARRLCELSGLDRAFITNSGAESVETAIKLGRKFAAEQGRGGEVITFSGCFHGRTMATIATGDEKYQRGFEPLPGGFRRLPFNDVNALSDAISDQTAAIMLEPIQGEGGVNPATPEFMLAARELCDRHGLALIHDEVQTGIGRTGSWFAFEHYSVKPDIMALAKGLGGGFPVGATLCTERIAEAINFGDHGTTFGGNPLACSAALATLETIDSERLVSIVDKQGERLLKVLREAAATMPQIVDVRGRGLMLGVELNYPGATVVQAMLRRGMIGNCTQERVMRLVPPLNTPEQDLDRMVAILLESIEERTDNGGA